MQLINKWAAWCISAAAAAMMAACVPGGEATEGAEKESASFLRSENAIPNQYIVVFRDDLVGAQSTELMASDLAEAYTGKVKQTFGQALNGFVAEIEDEEAARALAEEPAVAFVEEDAVITLNADQSPATWGLDRIDQASLPLNNRYFVDGNDGAGVHVYVIDTGIRATHNEFAGRVGNGFDAVDNDNNPNDCNGHGTHVAGTAVGSIYGVAKAATLHGVRVLSCSGSGSTSGVIAGVDWVTQNHISPAVANMSLGGGISASLDQAVESSIAAGVTYALAAGNSNANACNSSPARTPAAITVGATTNSDGRSSFSNFGSCVDIFAPGSSITAAWYQSDSQTNTISGTSMASPHVAGAAALYLGENPNASPAAVGQALVNGGVTGRVGNPGSGSPNVLLNVEFIGGGNPPPPPPPPPPPSGDSFDYSATRTRSARSGTTNQDIPLLAGQTLTIGTCGVDGASVSGDSYLRLYRGNSQVALNDDNCGGLGSRITYTASQTGTYQIRAGCYSNRSCSGTVAWTIQ